MRPTKEKKERSLGIKLFIKGDRCNSPKCAMVRHPYRPGQHGQARHSVSDFGKQLQEKQKIQIIYGLNNSQMMKMFRKYGKEEIMVKLESRLDHVVFLLGFSVLEYASGFPNRKKENGLLNQPLTGGEGIGQPARLRQMPQSEFGI